MKKIIGILATALLALLVNARPGLQGKPPDKVRVGENIRAVITKASGEKETRDSS